ncbi:MAG TPA: FAD-dependent oxidoreductase [Actinocrinis sp.]|nr:FAD-dependent oxidoreductase [Actinocrinis sp.]
METAVEVGADVAEVRSIVIIGAGIVGASVAYHVARLGLPVTLIDQASSVAAGVTGGSFAWIGATAGGGWPGGSDDLRGEVLADWRRLEAEVPGVAVRWTGSLIPIEDDAAGGSGQGLQMEEAGGDLEAGQHLIGRGEIAALEPNLRVLPERAVSIPSDGGVDPTEVTEALVAAARRLGARVVLGAGAASLKTVDDGRVVGVESSARFHPATTVVLAAGTGIPALCAPLGVEVVVDASPAFRMSAAAPAGLVRTIFVGSDFEVREVRDEVLLVTAPLSEERDGAAELAESAERAESAALEQLAGETTDRVRSTFGEKSIRLLEYQVGWRPVPPGGPVIGYLTPDKSVYVAVMNSAVTLAPTIGRLIADELVTGRIAPELARCRLPAPASDPGSR